MDLNDFPKHIVRKTINKLLEPKNGENVTDEHENMVKLFIPFEKGISQKLAKVCRKYNMKLIHTKAKQLKSMFKPNYGQQSNSVEERVVYEVKCKDCDRIYIGETGRKLNIRLEEHKKGGEGDQRKVSGLSQHMQQSKHNINFNDAKIIYKENFKKRKLREGITIKKCKGLLLNKKEEIKPISEIWESII